MTEMIDVQDVFNLSIWKELDDEQKAKIISNQFKKARGVAKTYLLNSIANKAAQ